MLKSKISWKFGSTTLTRVKKLKYIFINIED